MSSTQPYVLHKILNGRRLTLLLSIAGLGVAIAVGASAAYRDVDLSPISVGHAAEVAHAPVGFADLVAKVKPAVISVRVKIEEAGTSGLGMSENANPFPPGSPVRGFRNLRVPSR
jgi:serine protease Do